MSKKRSRTWEQQLRVDQQNSYDEYHTKQIKLKLNLKTDADILDWLYKKALWNSGTSMQGEIKRLIREEIAKEVSESCRCTPTEKEGTASDSRPKADPLVNQYLSSPEVQGYLRKYPDATVTEKEALAKWLAAGHSFLDNANFLADENGYTMDFIQGERAYDDWQEAMMMGREISFDY